MVITQCYHNVVKYETLQRCPNAGLQCCHTILKLCNLAMCPSRADVKTDLTKIQPVGNVVVTYSVCWVVNYFNVFDCSTTCPVIQE